MCRVSGRTRVGEEMLEVGDSKIDWGVSKKIKDGECDEEQLMNHEWVERRINYASEFLFIRST